MYVVQDHGQGSVAVLKVEDGNATVICTVDGADHRGGQIWADVRPQEQSENPAIAIGRILCIELERRDAMK